MNLKPANLSLAARVRLGSQAWAGLIGVLLWATPGPVTAAQPAVDAAELLAVVLDESTDLQSRRKACRALVGHGTEKTAAVLAPLLAKTEMSDDARLVIEGIPSTVADLALIGALGKTEGEMRRGIIASLAARETGAAFAPLVEIVARTDEATAVVALRALAVIARDAKDANVIAALAVGEGEPLLIAQQEAFFNALARLVARGTDLDAVVIPLPKMQARTAEVADLAVGVMLRINPAHAVPQIVAMYQTGDPDYFRRATSAIALLPDAETRLALVGQAASIPATAWPMMIGMLADYGGPEILPLVRAGLSATDESTRSAALAALGRLGDASDVAELLEFAAGGGAMGRQALGALERLPDRQADAALIAELERTDSAVRVALPDVLAARAVRAAIPALLAVARTAERRLAAECYGAAGRLGDASMMPELWERWKKSNAEDRPAVERALVAIGRGDPTGAATRQITTRWKGADAAMRAAVLRMAGGVGDTAALEFLRLLAQGRKPNEAAVRVLAAWRTPDGFPVLRGLLEAGNLPGALRQVVWDGMFDIARDRLRNARWEADGHLDACMTLTKRIEDRHRVLAVTAKGDSDEQLALLERWSSDAALGLATEAAFARDAMKERMAME